MDISTITRIGGRTLLHLQKNSPGLLTGAGIVAGVAAGITGAKATLKLEPVIDEAKEYIKLAKEKAETPDEQKKQLAYVYTRTVVKVAKLYAPTLGLAALSITCVLSAQGIMQRRNVALAAAYKTLETAFGEYRGRVRAEVGDEKERKLYFDLGEKEIEEGDKASGRLTEKRGARQSLSEYAKCFDETNRNWNGTPEYNLLFLRAQENFANDMLKARGHVFLNDVYDSLGIPRTKAGAVVGWVKNNGDDYIDFGIYAIDRPMALEFVNGHESAIWLDFNVDGVIYDLI